MFLNRCLVLLLSGFLAVGTVAAKETPAPEKIRPTGVPATAAAKDDSESDSPVPKKSARKKSAKRAVQSDEDASLGTLPNGVPVTKAKSVMVIDAQTGHILYE